MLADLVHEHFPRTSYATAYCLHGRMADGSHTRPHSVAHNGLRLGTRIRLRHPAFGLRNLVVRDTGPALADGHFDIWVANCNRAIRWGRRSIHYRIVSSK